MVRFCRCGLVPSESGRVSLVGVPSPRESLSVDGPMHNRCVFFLLGKIMTLVVVGLLGIHGWIDFERHPVDPYLLQTLLGSERLLKV